MTIIEIQAIIHRLPKKQRAAFDRICIGDDTRIPPATAEALVRKGLVEAYGEMLPAPAGKPAWLAMEITRYRFASIPVHMAWCDACCESEGHDAR